MRGPLTLALDASTYAATAALLDGDRLLADRAVAMRGEHEEGLMPTVADLLASQRAVPHDLEAIICGAGPGSFTSLRIAASIAKGLALASGAALVAVSSLQLIVAGSDATRGAGRWLASLNAMRGDRFAQLFTTTTDGRVAAAGEPMLIAADELAPRAAELTAERIGPGQPVDASPQARGVTRLLPALLRAGAVSLDAWEPSYGRLAEAQVRWEAVHERPLSGR